MTEQIVSAAAPVPNISGLTADRTGDEAATGAHEPYDWIDRARAGNKDAFGELYKRYRPAIFRLVRASLGADADDAVAETFMRAWAALPRYRKTGAPFAAWLYGIARHVVVDTLRSQQRTQAREHLPETVTSDRRDDNLDLAAAIARLPKRQRQVVEMKYLMGFTNPEVARSLGISIGAVNAKQWRALRTLEKMLERA